MDSVGLSDAEIELLIDGLHDDVSISWVLQDLEIWPTTEPCYDRPSVSDVNTAFAVLARLDGLGLVKIGRIEYIDGGPPGLVAPVRHVEEPLDLVRQRVIDSCRQDRDWEWSCWVVTTEAGDAIARRVLASRPDSS